MKKKKGKTELGFTLVELIIVIAIIGILAGIAIPKFMEANKAARGAKIVADMRTIESALNIYYVKYGEYPATKDTTGFAEIVNDGTWPVPPIGDFTIVHTIGTTGDGPTVGTCSDETAYTYTASSEDDAFSSVTLTDTTQLSNCANNTSPTVTELLAGETSSAYNDTVSNISSLFSLYNEIIDSGSGNIGINFIYDFINSDANRSVSEEFLEAYGIDTGFNEDLEWYADYNKNNDGIVLFLTTAEEFDNGSNWSAVLVVTEDGTVYTSNATTSSGETDFASISAAVEGDSIPDNGDISTEIGDRLTSSNNFTKQTETLDI
jgi:general secretion pathway protein G